MKKLNKKNILKRFRNIDVEAIQDEGLRSKARKLKSKQSGFTLLELLVVVAILAAIAGTATIALQDTDARASAAAHVAMMDEMNKGIRTFRVLNRGVFPNGFDSLVQVDTVALDNPVLMEALAIDDTSIGLDTITIGQFGQLADIGLSSFNYVAEDQDPADFGTCAAGEIQNLIGSRQNAVVAGNIFLSANGNGCGVRAQFNGDTAGDGSDVPGWNVFSQAEGAAGPTEGAANVADPLPIAVWVGGSERLTGQAEDGAFNALGNTVFMATGLGPASSLFEANKLGGMTSVPVYRHVSADEYNRFIAIWDIGTYDGAGEIVMGDAAALTTIVDGAGDTKEEELGEWDGSRNTI
ncbi:hypothetical protein A9Q99_05260 [Gammaproteobacteria bacterium 45_16_T64]|nr:hypothetical protein A9Q99_05260 [Gammaproteobacteria bacterium 45_16_T64]